MTKKKIIFNLILLLCIFMPLHSMVIDKIIGPRTTGVVNLWRDFVIVLLLLLSGKILKNKFQITILLCVCWILVCMMTSLLAGFSTTYLTINMARTYIMPMMLCVAVSSTKISFKQFVLMLQIIWIEGITLVVFGTFQVFVLGSDFLVNMGYGADGRLTPSFYINGFYGFQRMVATFSSPNDCGLYLSGIFLISLIGKKYIEERFRNIYIAGMAILFFGIVLTLSRTSMLAVSFSTIVYFYKYVNWKRNISKLAKYLVVVFFLGVVALSADYKLLNGRVINMFFTNFKNAVGGTDASFLKHFEDLYKPIEYILCNPFGFGFGTNGPVAVSVLGESNSHAVESSIWLMGYETGIIGILLYFLPFIYLLVKIFKRRNIYSVTIMASFLSLCTLIAFLSLPFCSSYESTFLMYLFAGLSFGTKSSQYCIDYNKKKETDYISESLVKQGDN